MRITEIEDVRAMEPRQNGEVMLLAIKYGPSEFQSQEDRRRTRRLFMKWEPPPGVEIQAHYHLVSGGGFMVVESDSPGALYESLEPFKPKTLFDIEPVVNVIEAVSTSIDVEDWADSVLDTGDP
jgi:hypothetical protein